MSILANEWSAKGHAVTLVTFASKDQDFYPLSRSIHRITLDKPRDFVSPLQSLLYDGKRILNLRKTISHLHPDVVLSFIDQMNILTLGLTIGLDVPVVVSERIDPRFHPIGYASNLLRRVFYRRARAVVTQTDEVTRWMRAHLKLSTVLTIPNPVCVPKGSSTDIKESHVPSAPFVAAMGRLHHQKGYDLLIKAFSLIVRDFPDWKLVILGEGAERLPLSNLAGELGIQDRLFMPGTIRNPELFLKQAGFFVLSSRYEGFPNALLEAMACGLPVISFDCPSGPGEIIRDGYDGILVPPGNTEALAAAMKGLITMPDEKRRQMGRRAKAVIDRFSVDKIGRRWENLFHQIIDVK